MISVFLKTSSIILLCIIACVGYGVVHNQITARICIEYFTIGHPTIVNTNSPTVLGLAWGVLATWWVGAILGIGLALTAQLGSLPKLGPKNLLVPVLKLMGCCLVVAILFGIIGYVLTINQIFYLVEPMKTKVPEDKHLWFLVNLWIHLGSYLSGFIGGVILAVLTYRKRRRSVELSIVGSLDLKGC